MARYGVHWSLVESICETMGGSQRMYQHSSSKTLEHSVTRHDSDTEAVDAEPHSVQRDIFTLFALLPKELRLQIWTYALEPRVIPLHLVIGEFRGRYRSKSRVMFNYMALATNHPSLDVIRYVCPEAQLLCERSYFDWQVWDVKKHRMGTPYNPARDVIYFSKHISASTLLDFAREFPMEAGAMRTIALPGILFPNTASRVEALAVLHEFERLGEVFIVLAKQPAEKENASAVWQGGAILKDTWILPRAAEDVLDRLKAERFPEWKLPIVTIVKSYEAIPRY